MNKATKKAIENYRIITKHDYLLNLHNMQHSKLIKLVPENEWSLYVSETIKIDDKYAKKLDNERERWNRHLKNIKNIEKSKGLVKVNK